MVFRLLKPCLSLALTLLVSGEAVADFKSSGIRKYDQAVLSGVRYLKSMAGKIPERESSLVAYALLKAGEPTSSGLVQKGLRDASQRAQSGYSGYDQIYLAGVDAMLLADTDPQRYRAALQTIADFISARQHRSGGWSETATNADTSMAQYGMLALWAAQRAGADVSLEVVERGVQWHLANGEPDGGWDYRPERSKGKSNHNRTMAGAGSLGIGHLMLFNSGISTANEKKFGVLEAVSSVSTESKPNEYQPRISSKVVSSRVERAFAWITPRFPPPQGPPTTMPYYFFYALERAASLHDLGEVNGKNWFETYGDVLLTMQNNSNGAFDRGTVKYSSYTIGTSFAILYFMRSTQQILDKQYGTGVLSGGRGLDNLFGKKKKKKPLTPLDELLSQMEKADLTKLDATNTQDLVENITFGSREELIGQVDVLKKLLKHPDAANRQAAYFGLGRTGNFSLIPLMLKGLRDPHLDVNTEAILALRYISRKPNGFDLPLAPATLAKATSDKEKVLIANVWRNQVHKRWATWYNEVRPYEERGGLDEVELQTSPNNR